MTLLENKSTAELIVLLGAISDELLHRHYQRLSNKNYAEKAEKTKAA